MYIYAESKYRHVRVVVLGTQQGYWCGEVWVESALVQSNLAAAWKLARLQTSKSYVAVMLRRAHKQL